ncbi:MAG TPA: hypothetical protein VN653_01840 [Anaerolineales bacterium]|nr:hypothetical protein [Anaerolineales bacterium]
MFYRTLWVLDKVFSILILAIAVTGDAPRLTGQTDQVRTYTRAIEFDYPTWVWNAVWSKIDQGTINAPYVFDRGANKQIVFEYLRTTDELGKTDARIEQIFADPNITDKESESAFLRTQRDKLLKRQTELAPFAESIFQSQISNVLAELDLTAGGQTLPPVLYHNSPTPLALIVSPRDHIEQITNVSVLPALTLDQQIKLEDDVAKSLNVSTLIVPIGGIGVYPTMVMETTDLHWMLSTIAHEWTHNYLNLRPLGINYSTTPELRTMNETTASISGDEVGNRVLEEYYPELVVSASNPGLPQFNMAYLPSSRLAETPPFDFREEMHTTRVKADELLAQGKISEAEAYMEQRRLIFWQNGYLLRKLNQAYFAFHGAYADVPGGAAGEDPVGPAVRALREQSKSLADFINTISWMTSFQQLQEAIQK